MLKLDAVNTACKAIAIARDFLAGDDLDLLCYSELLPERHNGIIFEEKTICFYN